MQSLFSCCDHGDICKHNNIISMFHHFTICRLLSILVFLLPNLCNCKQTWKRWLSLCFPLLYLSNHPNHSTETWSQTEIRNKGRIYIIILILIQTSMYHTGQHPWWYHDFLFLWILCHVSDCCGGKVCERCWFNRDEFSSSHLMPTFIENNKKIYVLLYIIAW